MLRTKPPEVRLTAPDDTVEAREDLQVGGTRWIPRGTRLKRDDPVVVEHPHLFCVKYILSEEVTEDG